MSFGQINFAIIAIFDNLSSNNKHRLKYIILYIKRVKCN